jgi:hypothetical protein
MTFRNRKKSNALLATGLLFLSLGGILRIFIPHIPHLKDLYTDGLTGFCYGLGIVLMLGSFIRNSRQRRCNSSAAQGQQQS